MKHFTPQDHYDKREDLGNCFETAQEEDPENLLLGFLKEFGDGFDLGWKGFLAWNAVFKHFNKSICHCFSQRTYLFKIPSCLKIEEYLKYVYEILTRGWMIEDADWKLIIIWNMNYEILTKGRMMEDADERRSKVRGKFWVWEGVETWAGTWALF